MNTKRICTLLTPVIDSSDAKILSRSGIVLVHIAAAGLATFTLPIASCIIAIVGLGLYMIGARQTLLNAESMAQAFRA